MTDHTFNAAQPVAWTNEHQLGYLKDPEWASVPMAMWGKPNGAARIPLYASQPSPAATVETEEWAEVTDGTTKEGDRFSYIGNTETGVGQITSHKRRVQRSSADSATQKFDNGLVGTELAAWCQANPFSAAQMIERWRDTALIPNEPQSVVWHPIETAPRGPVISVARKGGQRDDGSTYWYQAIGHYDPNLGHFHKSYGELYGEPELWARYPENPERCPPLTRPLLLRDEGDKA